MSGVEVQVDLEVMRSELEAAQQRCFEAAATCLAAKGAQHLAGIDYLCKRANGETYGDEVFVGREEFELARLACQNADRDFASLVRKWASRIERAENVRPDPHGG